MSFTTLDFTSEAFLAQEHWPKPDAFFPDSIAAATPPPATLAQRRPSKCHM
jgi:hypothetical protein